MFVLFFLLLISVDGRNKARLDRGAWLLLQGSNHALCMHKILNACKKKKENEQNERKKKPEWKNWQKEKKIKYKKHLAAPVPFDRYCGPTKTSTKIFFLLKKKRYPKRKNSWLNKWKNAETKNIRWILELKILFVLFFYFFFLKEREVPGCVSCAINQKRERGWEKLR